MNQPTFLTEYSDWLDWHSLGNANTELAPSQIQRAAQLSLSITVPEQCWQVYLCALGVMGFEQWLNERAPDLQVQVNQSSIWQPGYANLLPVATNIQVGAFKVCIITASKVSDVQSIPFAVFDVPHLVAHFYVLMQVEEELQQAGVFGFISFKQFQSYKKAASLKVDQDWTYSVDNDQFNLDPEALLLNLRCLDASAIELPVNIPVAETDTSISLQQKLTQLQFDLKKHPSQFLTVEEATTLFSNPDLINSLYALTCAEVVTNTADSQVDNITNTNNIDVSAPGVVAPQASIQPLINVGLWLRNQIDAVASELGWMLMPTLSPAPLRTSDEFQRIRDGLEAQKIYIPPTAQGASRDLNSECGALRLYAVIWELDAATDNPEWMLLIVLGQIANVPMPRTLKLQVRDQTQELFNQTLEDTSTGILYTRLIGDANDRFWVTITADNSTVFEIPPFGMVESE